MPEPVSLAYAMRLPPREAIAYFESKGYLISWNWFDVADEAHARAFTVAKAARQDILQDFRDAMNQVLREGVTEPNFIRKMTPVLKAKGWWGEQIIVGPDGVAETVRLGSPHRLRTIYRTNKMSAYHAGRYMRHKRRATSRPYWQYVAIMDSRTRPSHAALNGMVFRHDDPIWGRIYPPNGFNCRCRVRALSLAALERAGLKVSSSEGMYDQRMVEAGVDKRTGEVVMKPVTEVRVPGRDNFRTDPGFNNAPVDHSFDPWGGLPDAFPGDSGRNLNFAVDSLPTWSQRGLPDVRNLPDQVRIAMPSLLQTPADMDARIEAIASAVGLTGPVRWVDTPGDLDRVPITMESLRHIAEGPGDRARFSNLILPTLTNPAEVWDVPYQDGTVRRRFMALFGSTDRSRAGLGVVRINRDGSLFWTWVQKNLRDMNSQREGVIRWLGY